MPTDRTPSPGSEPVPDVSPDVPGLRWRTTLALLRRLPQNALSRTFGRIADVPLPPPLRRPVLGAFARAVGIDIGEAELPLTSYPTLNAFFVRRLRAGARRWPAEPEALASPVDGVMGRSGRIEQGTALQAKGHSYDIAELLNDEGEAERFEGGHFLTIYLSPRHYHRIHTPAAGTIERATHVPGALLPVNAPAVMHLPRLFTRNERLICYLEAAGGGVAVVAVGAYNVGRISAVFDATWSGSGRDPWVTNRATPGPLERRYDPAVEVGTGEEIMAFHLGSTIVLLLEPGFRLRPDLHAGREVRVGEVIGTVERSG